MLILYTFEPYQFVGYTIMTISYDILSVREIYLPIVTIGTFDGIHKGHREILNHLIKEAHSIGGTSVVITFQPHPRKVLFPEQKDFFLLTSDEEKKCLFNNSGIDHLIILPFTHEFSNLSAEDFIQEYLINRIKIKKLIIGRDHQFGRKREGNHNNLMELSKKYHFDCIEIPEYLENDIDVSSTKIRNAIKDGDLVTANNLLSIPYFITGTVVEGNKLGRQIGFPTANIQLDTSDKLLPQNGVYVVKAEINKQIIDGMMNIGIRPTFGFEQLTIEVNLFNFNQNIYGHTIRIYILERLRDEMKFNSVEELKAKLFCDKHDSERQLKNYLNFKTLLPCPI